MATDSRARRASPGDPSSARLGYQQLLPDDLKPRINEFTINQLVALRFASDSEFPALARKSPTAAQQRKAIKQTIQTWGADCQRI